METRIKDNSVRAQCQEQKRGVLSGHQSTAHDSEVLHCDTAGLPL